MLTASPSGSERVAGGVGGATGEVPDAEVVGAGVVPGAVVAVVRLRGGVVDGEPEDEGLVLGGALDSGGVFAGDVADGSVVAAVAVDEVGVATGPVPAEGTGASGDVIGLLVARIEDGVSVLFDSLASLFFAMSAC